MHRAPQKELRDYLSFKAKKGLDQQQIWRFKREMVRDFHHQLTYGAPSNADEQGLRQLARQLKTKKVVVKLFLRYPLHAKLYLIHRQDKSAPTLAFLGSSNLTLAGLKRQGELNAELIDIDASGKLKHWFEDRWQDRWCLDITDDLIEVIDSSWAREDMLSPYELYLKIVYHLAQEARAGLNEFKLPREFEAQSIGLSRRRPCALPPAILNTRGGVFAGRCRRFGQNFDGDGFSQDL